MLCFSILYGIIIPNFDFLSHLVQLEQRIILEKEREFALSKYENKLGLLMGLRSDIDHSYHLIHQLEEKYNVLDAKNMALDKRRHDNKR